MSTINRVPDGFLGLLDAKTGGRTPLDIEQRLQTVLDLTSFYAANLPLETEIAIGTVTGADVGNLVLPVTVPDGEQWFVRGVSGQMVVPVAANGYRFEIAVDTTTGLGLHFLTGGDQFTQTQSQFESVVAVHNFTPWAIFGPGTRIGIGVTQIVPNNATTTTSVLFHRVRV